MQLNLKIFTFLLILLFKFNIAHSQQVFRELFKLEDDFCSGTLKLKQRKLKFVMKIDGDCDFKSKLCGKFEVCPDSSIVLMPRNRRKVESTIVYFRQEDYLIGNEFRFVKIE